MLQRISGWSTKRKVIAGIAALIAISIIIGAISSVLESEESKQARLDVTVTAEAVKLEEQAAKEAEETRNKEQGLHCLSQWNGHHDGLIRLVKRELNDPDSLDARETTIVKVGVGVGIMPAREGQHIILMNFTAKNALGGTVRSDAVGYVDNDSCEAELIRWE